MRNTPITKIYISDFETRAGENAEREAKTWVWAWGICGIENIELVEIGSNIRLWFDYIKTLGNGICYFHNLKFDGFFILSLLYELGYTPVKKRSDVKKGDNKYFSCLVSDRRAFYSITVSTGKDTCMEFRDSYKKLPFSVEGIAKSFKTKYKKLDLNYTLERPEDYVIPKDEEEYLKCDVRVIAEVIKRLHDSGFTKLTIGSDALNTFIDMMGGKKKFRAIFPVFDEELHQFCKEAYRGGWSYVNPLFKGYTLNCNGYTFDVNSLYPSMLHSNVYTLANGKHYKNKYPYGMPIKFEGKPKADKNYPLKIIHFTAEFVLKPGYLPFIQLRNDLDFKKNVHVMDSRGPKEMWLCDVDFELFRKHYEVLGIQYHDGYKFKARSGFFDKYVDRFFEQKINSEGAEKEEAKLHLNNIYGKFAQAIKGFEMIPTYENGVVKFVFGEEETREPVYMPVAVYCTAYARRFTITACQENYDIFAYSDTDSGHFIEYPKNINVHPFNLSCWKEECNWTSARFIRQKCYMEFTPEIEHRYSNELTSNWDIKCAGMTKDSKAEYLRQVNMGVKDVDDFNIGLEIFGKQLKAKVVKGGVVLYPKDFKMRA